MTFVVSVSTVSSDNFLCVEQFLNGTPSFLRLDAMLCMMSSESSCHQHQFANQRYMYGPTHHHLLVAVHLVVSFPQEPGNEAIHLVACDLGARHSAPPPGLDLAH